MGCVLHTGAPLKTSHAATNAAASSRPHPAGSWELRGLLSRRGGTDPQRGAVVGPRSLSTEGYSWASEPTLPTALSSRTPVEVTGAVQVTEASSPTSPRERTLWGMVCVQLRAHMQLPVPIRLAPTLGVDHDRQCPYWGNRGTKSTSPGCPWTLSLRPSSRALGLEEAAWRSWKDPMWTGDLLCRPHVERGPTARTHWLTQVGGAQAGHPDQIYPVL